MWPEGSGSGFAGLGRLDVEVGLRAAGCLVVPLLLLHFLGRDDLAVYAAFGAFTSLYGRVEMYRHRAVNLLAVAATFIGLAALAMGVALLGSPMPLVVVLTGLITIGGIVVSSAMNWIPFGSLFFVFEFSVLSLVPVAPGEFWLRLGIVAAVSVLCTLVSMSGWLVRRVPGRHQDFVRELRPVSRDRDAWTSSVVWIGAIEAGVAAVAALLIAAAVGLSHPYWAAVAVIVSMPRPGSPRLVTKAVQRIFGTFCGVLITAVILAFHPGPVAIILCIGAAQLLAELLIGKVYWLAVWFVTPLALLSMQLAMPQAAGPLLADRMLDTALGGLVAIVAIFAGTGAVVTWKAHYSAEAAAGSAPLPAAGAVAK